MLALDECGWIQSGSGERRRRARTGAKAEAVQYLYPEQVTVPAGKATPVALHFRIKQGLHINSHTPKMSS